MDRTTARAMSEQTSAFYRRVSTSFSATRQNPWAGWERLCDLLYPEGMDSLRILDLACGNLRFERFLANRMRKASAESVRHVEPHKDAQAKRSSQDTPRLDVWAYDNCDALVAEGLEQLDLDVRAHIRYHSYDLATLSSARDAAIDAPLCDLSVSMAFLHHLPLPEQRRHVLGALLEHTRPGGHVAVSLWQFAKDPRIIAKAHALESPGDYLLGWQEEEGVRRYCHSFSDDEVDELATTTAARAREVARYWSDGRRGDLNCYLVFEVAPS